MRAGTMKVLWQIEKKYDTYETVSNESENLGKQKDVYVETINKIIQCEEKTRGPMESSDV